MIAHTRRTALSFIGRTVVAGLLGLTFVAVSPAWAQSLESLRASGVLGERYDGLVAVRQASADANRVAGEVNAQRQALYKKRAAEQGVAWEQVGRVYAQQIFAQSPKGTWFLTEQGWVQK
jgi:uncharacterized protein YdbL (DUF1318 family)